MRDLGSSSKRLDSVEKAPWLGPIGVPNVVQPALTTWRLGCRVQHRSITGKMLMPERQKVIEEFKVGSSILLASHESLQGSRAGA